MVAGVEVMVGLGLLEIGEDLFEGPFVVACLGPEVKVLPFATEEVGAVDGAGAAGDSAARNHGGYGLVCSAGLEVPEVMAFEDGGSGAVEVFELGRKAVQVGEVLTSLDQEDGTVGVLGQTAGQHGSTRTRADNDVVILHCQASASRVTGGVNPSRDL